MAALLALASAATFSIADFLGGMASRRAHELVVALLSQVAGLAVLAVVLPLSGVAPLRAALLWGLVAGVGGAGGLVAYFRALAIGPMGITAPLAALVAAGVPVVVGLAAGERTGPLAAVGILCAIVAAALVSRPPTPDEEPLAGPHGTLAEHLGHEASQRDVASAPHGDHASVGSVVQCDVPAPVMTDATTTPSPSQRPDGLRRGLVAALVAGMLFGLFTVALDQAPNDGGLWPLLTARVAGLTLLGVLIATRRPPRPSGSSVRVALGSGLLDMVANVFLLLATQQGSLVVVGVLASLYPVGIALMARMVLHEALGRVQWLGVGMAVAATVLIGL